MVCNSQIHIQIEIIVEHEIVVELSGTALECPWSRFFERPGVVDATTLARLSQNSPKAAMYFPLARLSGMAARELLLVDRQRYLYLLHLGNDSYLTQLSLEWVEITADLLPEQNQRYGLVSEFIFHEC